MHDWSPALVGRVRSCNEAVSSDPHGSDYVLCRVRQTLRAWDNPLIDAAVELGNALGLPVLVYYGIPEDYPHASDRLHNFMLGAGRDLQIGCRDRGLRCVTHVDRAGHRDGDLVGRLADRAAAVLTDEHPVRFASDELDRFAAQCRVRLYAVETASLVPTRLLPDGLTTTPAFRKASGALRPEYEAVAYDFEPVVPAFAGEVCVADDGLADLSDAGLSALIAACAIDHSLPPSEAFEPSAAAAKIALDAFIAGTLGMYSHTRNNPADEDGVSRLSPYLHFGVLGPRGIVRAVREADVSANARWKYLDELLTWREYFRYLAERDVQSESFAGIPDRARRFLLDHAGDERPTLHSLSDLVHGRTADETWNAGQRQWLATGYMHNNLRMYWGKQLLKWTRDPETAWATACYLNDRLSLDGRDPSTYGNMQWVFGRSKSGWKELPIYGWVAARSDRALRKRDGAAAWLKDWAERPTPEIDVPEGMPHDVFDGARTRGG